MARHVPTAVTSLASMLSGGSPITTSRLATRALGTAGLRYTSLLVGLALSALIARALGPEGRGQYYYPILVVLTLHAFLHLSLDPANLFLFSQRRVPFRDLVAQAGMFALLIGTAGAIVGLAGWLALQDSLMAGVPLAHFALALAPLPFMLHTLYLTGLLLLRGGTVTIQAIGLAGSIGQLAAMGALLLVSGGALRVGTVLMVNSVALLLLWGLTLRSTRTLAPVRPRWQAHVAGPALRVGLHLHGGLVLLFLATRLDAYIVKYLLGMTALGYYSLAIALTDLVKIATDSVAAAAVPRQTDLALGAAAGVTAKACRVSLALGAMLSLVLALAAYPLVLVVYGRAFLPSIAPLLLLLPGVTVGALVRPLGYYLVRVGRPLLLSAINGGCAILSLTLSTALIHHLGLTGAAVAASLSGLSMAVCHLAWFQHRSGLPLREILWLRREDLSGIRLARRSTLPP